PNFTRTTVTVPTYYYPPAAAQKGSPSTTAVNLKPIILNVAFRNNQLAVAQTVGTSGDASNLAQARWYVLNVASTPALLTSGNVARGPGIHTYFPSVDLNTYNALCMTFMESSASEYVSVYATG